MLADFLDQLGEELQMKEFITKKELNHYVVELENDVFIDISTGFDNGFLLKSTICPIPTRSPDTFFDKMLMANLFGRETDKTVLGLDPNGNLLTLSLELNYSKNYQEFKEALEIFTRTIDTWRNEVLQHS